MFLKSLLNFLGSRSKTNSNRHFFRLISAINNHESVVSGLLAEQIRLKTKELQERFKKDGISEALIIEAFSLVRESAKRTISQRHFDEQLMGGLALINGGIAELKTGEGKTLMATLPAYTRALSGKGVHLVTVNDYLAQRDTVWMGQIYHYLGLRVGCLVHDQAFVYDPDYVAAEKSEVNKTDTDRDTRGGFQVFHEYLRPVKRQEAYDCEIVYGTNHEFGFDYLRDHLVYEPGQGVQRGQYYAIIDEVDSILIDEARTPLIISGPDADASRIYREFSRVAPRLKHDTDYTVDEKQRTVILTESGIKRVEEILGRPIYTENNLVLIHHLEQALRAQALFLRDKHYVVKDGEVIIVDEFTGRLMFGRRYEGGLHQALEAKEGVRVQEENRTIATITIQNYFRAYEILGGMTGTALTSAEEFHKVYGLEVSVIPTHKPMIRADLTDQVLVSERAKFKKVVQEIRARHEKGQPVLVGTISIEKNESLSKLLSLEGIPHSVLNAKQHEQEGGVIAQAGKRGAVTIATNMAGRGVDIILGGNPFDQAEAEFVKSVGGLHVIGTERHESKRIDNQLRGRSGRQGDPGSSQFFVSLEDDLMRIFGSEKIKNMVMVMGLKEDDEPVVIENRLVSRALDAAQAKVEGLNFDMRKHVLEYDDVLNKQRTTLYHKRQGILFAPDEEIRKTVEENLRLVIHQGCVSESVKEESVSGFFRSLEENKIIRPNQKEKLLAVELIEQEQILWQECESKLAEHWQNHREKATRTLLLQVLDILWIEHLDMMQSLSDAARLRGYHGHYDSLVVYKTEGHRAFQALLNSFSYHVFWSLMRAAV
jgi:preprotein translocase subunit SecA